MAVGGERPMSCPEVGTGASTPCSSPLATALDYPCVVRRGKRGPSRALCMVDRQRRPGRRQGTCLARFAAHFARSGAPPGPSTCHLGTPARGSARRDSTRRRPRGPECAAGGPQAITSTSHANPSSRENGRIACHTQVGAALAPHWVSATPSHRPRPHQSVESLSGDLAPALLVLPNPGRPAQPGIRWPGRQPLSAMSITRPSSVSGVARSTSQNAATTQCSLLADPARTAAPLPACGPCGGR